MRHTTSIISALLAMSASAKPVSPVARDCTWDDSNGGNIPCSTFTVVVGAFDASTVLIQGNDFNLNNQKNVWDSLDCGTGYIAQGAWKSFISPLPYTVDIFSGDSCGQGGKGVIIKYANVQLDPTSDARCGSYSEVLAATKYRCLIPINP